MIDTHVHLYANRFLEDQAEVVVRAREAGVARMVLPAIDVASVEKALELCDRYEGLYAMSALHPSDTQEATDADFEKIVAFCDDPRVVAVGESGLDYYWDRSFDERQHYFFRQHIQLSIAKDLPLILHIRDKQGREEAHRDTVRILQEEVAKASGVTSLRGIFHCFTGPASMVQAAQELGFLFGVGGVLTYKNSGLDALLADVPLSQIVLETDAPYLAPTPHRGQRNEPAYVHFIAEKLAEVKEVSLEEVMRITTENATRLFRLD